MVAVSELVSGLDAELVRVGYKPSTMVWYRGCWRRLERSFASRGVQEFFRGPLHTWSELDVSCPKGILRNSVGLGRPDANARHPHSVADDAERSIDCAFGHCLDASIPIAENVRSFIGVVVGQLKIGTKQAEGDNPYSEPGVWSTHCS